MKYPSAHAIHDAFVAHEISAVEITKQHLNLIQKLDPDIKAFLHVCEEKALQKAAALDLKRSQGKPLGKLAGVPIVIKDNIHMRGEKTTCASRILQGFEAPFDATVVKKLEEEDAILLGKTNLDEFAMGTTGETSAFFATKNPWDLRCVPGGSSSGSAAAVAARMAPLGLGSDTGGSVRMPASLTGIYGFKPTYGRVSRYGLVAYGSSLDQISPFGTDVEDIALCMEAISGACAFDATTIPGAALPYREMIKKPMKSLKIGVSLDFLNDLNPEIKANFDEAIEVYKSMGAEIVPVDLSILKMAIACYYIIATAEASTNLARFDGIRYGRRSPDAKNLEDIYDLSRQEGFGIEVKSRIFLGTFVLSAGQQDAFFTKAQKVRTKIIQVLQNILSECDLIAMPSSTMSAFPFGEVNDPVQLYLLDILTVPANLAGLPAISIPSGFDKNNLPLGIQLMGKQLDDALVLQAAYAFEQKTKHHQQMPKIARDALREIS